MVCYSLLKLKSEYDGHIFSASFRLLRCAVLRVGTLTAQAKLREGVSSRTEVVLYFLDLGEGILPTCGRYRTASDEI